MADPAPQFPDLQQKMSRKISQLTKVIHHLNNKNEDHDFELQDIAGQHESEIEHILREAAGRIKVFKEAMEAKKEQSRIGEITRELSEKYENGKKQALVEFEAYKKRAEEREMNLQRNYESKAENSAKEVEQVKAEFAKKIQEFKKAMEAAETAASSSDELRRMQRKEVDAAKLAAQAEIAEVTKRSNKRMSEIMAERLAVEEQLKAELEKSKADHDHALQETKDFYDAKLADIQNNFTTEAKNLREEISSEISKSDKLEEVLLRLNAELAAAAVSTQEKIAEMTSAIENLKIELENEKKKCENLEGVLGEGNAKGLELAARVSEVDKEATALKAELERIRKEAEAAAEESTDALAAKVSAISALENDFKRAQELNTNREKEIVDLGSKVDALSKDLAASQKNNEFSLSNVKELKLEILALKESSAKKEADMKRSLALTGSEAAQKSAALETEIGNLKEEIVKQVEQADNTRKEMQITIEKLNTEHAKELKELLEQHKSAVEKERKKAAAQESKLQKEMNNLRENFDKEKARLFNDFEQKLMAQKKQEEEAALKSEKEIEKLKIQIDQAEKNIGELETSVEKEKGTSKAQAEKSEKARMDLEGRLSGAIEEVYKLRRQLEDAEKKGGQLNINLEKATQDNKLLREELEETKKDAAQALREQEEKAAGENQRLVAEWTRRAEEKAREAMAASDRHHMLEVRQLRESLDAQKEAEKAELWATLKQNAAGREGDLLTKLNAAVAEREKLVVAHKAALEEAAADAERERQAGEAKYKEAMMVLQSEGAKKLEAARQEHSTQKQIQEEEFRRTLAEKESDFAAILEQKENNRKAASGAQLTEWQGRLDLATKESEKALTELKNNLEISHSREVAQVQKVHSEETNKLKQRLQSVEKNYAEKENVVGNLTGSVKELQANLAAMKKDLLNKNAELITTRSDLLREMRKQEADLQAKHQAELEALAEENLAETQELQKEFEEAKNHMEMQQAQMAEKFAILQARFDARESRPDDVAKICELENLVAHKEAEYRKLFDDTKRMRLELLNREENYNKMFAAQPKVQQDMVDWLKPKPRETTPLGSTASIGARSARVSIGGSAAGSKSTLSSNHRRASDNR